MVFHTVRSVRSESQEVTAEHVRLAATELIIRDGEGALNIYEDGGLELEELSDQVRYVVLDLLVLSLKKEPF